MCSWKKGCFRFPVCFVVRPPCFPFSFSSAQSLSFCCTGTVCCAGTQPQLKPHCWAQYASPHRGSCHLLSTLNCTEGWAASQLCQVMLRGWAPQQHLFGARTRRPLLPRGDTVSSPLRWAPGTLGAPALRHVWAPVCCPCCLGFRTCPLSLSAPRRLLSALIDQY